MLESLFNIEKKKEVPTQVFSCEYYEFFKKIYFEEHLQSVASQL